MSADTHQAPPLAGDAALRRVTFRCPSCDRRVEFSATGVACRSCDAAYRVANGAIDFMGPYKRVPDPGDGIVAATTQTIRTALELPDAAADEVHEAVAASLDRTGVAYVDAEIAALPSRFGAENFTSVSGGTVLSDSRRPVTLLWTFGPPVMPEATRLHRSVRLRAERPIEQGRVGVAYAWRRRLPGALGRLRERVQRAVRSAAAHPPIDLDEGREISLPVAIDTPAAPGRWTLSFVPVVDGRARMGDRHDVVVDVTPQAEPAHLTGEFYPDYGADHLAAIRMLQRYLGDGTPAVLLEVAAGVSPHLTPLAEDGHLVIASDVCANQARLGSVYCRYNMPHIAERQGYMAFDAFDPPFEPGQFDGVAMFSALHHFPEPSRFLAALARMVRPGGFVAALCEPADPDSVGADYVRDLLAGINEQVFTLAEYLWMVRDAGLDIQEVRNDGGSLKVIARRPQAVAATAGTDPRDAAQPG